LTAATLPLFDGAEADAALQRQPTYCEWSGSDFGIGFTVSFVVDAYDTLPNQLFTTVTLSDDVGNNQYTNFPGVSVVPYACTPFGFSVDVNVTHEQPPFESHTVHVVMTSTPNPPPVGPVTLAPSCSPCGAVVEMLRSCYRGKWRLCKDDATIETPGRYYFVKEGTPAYPHFHLLHSQTWYDKNSPATPSLGEIPVKTSWDRGNPPLELIPTDAVGSSSCIAEGEAKADMTDVADMRQGVPILCYVPTPGNPRAISTLESISLPCTQKFYAKIISLLYAGDYTSIQSMFDDVFQGAPYTFKPHPGGPQLPDTVAVIAGDSYLLVADGTSSFWQFAIQAIQSLAPPVNVGAWSTEQFWANTSVSLGSIISGDGAASAKKITLVGHSWGGVALSLLQAVIAIARGTDGLQILTYGSPKPGDARAAAAIARVNHVHLANDDDPIPIIPFDRTLLSLGVPDFGTGIFPIWGNWSSFIGETVLNTFGESIGARGYLATSEVIVTMVGNALAHTVPTPFGSHNIDEYLRRLTLQCPDV
jgi:hypothetical protein